METNIASHLSEFSNPLYLEEQNSNQLNRIMEENLFENDNDPDGERAKKVLITARNAAVATLPMVTYDWTFNVNAI